MPQLDPASLREYARRDWGAAERATRFMRAQLPLDVKIRLAIALYEAARQTHPGWPTAEHRQRDLADHQRVKALLQRAAHVGRR